MAAEKIMALNAYFDEKMAEHSERRAEFIADSRNAEADFEKIKHNVYDIFKTVLSAAGKVCNEYGEIKAFFLKKLVEIPANWKAALSKAEEHCDTERAVVEKLKLEAADDIRAVFEKIWGENND